MLGSTKVGSRSIIAATLHHGVENSGVNLFYSALALVVPTVFVDNTADLPVRVLKQWKATGQSPLVPILPQLVPCRMGAIEIHLRQLRRQ